jgi:hypothetical protein
MGSSALAVSRNSLSVRISAGLRNWMEMPASRRIVY